jgi:glycosyltransferase involved in cell wall biosynthesis
VSLATIPKISVIVIGYRMSRQLENTLFSLSANYQQGVLADDYEVIVMENSSVDNLSPEAVAALPQNFRYFLREETAATPVYAVNEAFSLCRASFICLMIDGARMASPGVIRAGLMASLISENAILAVPGYHLGHDEQHLVAAGRDQGREEAELLASVDWRADGYELFRVSTFSGANRHGYLQPIMECNCLFASAKNYAAIGHANTEFTLPGGGSINLHMYRSLCMLPGSELFVTPGEGSFHQYHGGVTTSSYAEREAEIEKHRIQLHSFWPDGFHSVRREPALLGRVAPQAQPFLIKSIKRSGDRIKRLRAHGKDIWPDDPVSSGGPPGRAMSPD